MVMVMLAWRRSRVAFTQDPESGKLLTLKQVVLLPMNLQLQDVVFDGDCLNIIIDLQSHL